MSVARTARRRRKQAAQNYNHLCRAKRPYYKRRSAEASKRHLDRILATERRIASKGRK